MIKTRLATSLPAALLLGACAAPLATVAPSGIAPSGAAPGFDAGSLPMVREIDEQVGFSHLTGGETWKSYDSLPAGVAEKGGFKAIREKRLPADLSNPRLRTLTRALGPL